MTDWTLAGQFVLDWLTLTFMLVGLAGLIIPIFPGLVVMWLATLIFALFSLFSGGMTTLGWVLFIVITVLMLGGSIIDNIVIAKKIRDYGTSWLSIGAGFLAGLIVSLFLTPLAGLVVTPLALFGAEYYRLRDRQKALESSKAWLIGFGWAFVIRFSIGVVMIVLWMFWAWS